MADPLFPIPIDQLAQEITGVIKAGCDAISNIDWSCIKVYNYISSNISLCLNLDSGYPPILFYKVFFFPKQIRYCLCMKYRWRFNIFATSIGWSTMKRRQTVLNFCYLCLEEILDSGYRCIECKWFYLHKSCFELSRELHHPFHRKHPLVLTKDRAYSNSPICYCYCCKKYLYRSDSFFSYSCLSCDFNLHLGCASLPPLPHTMEVQIHDHSLTLLRKLITFTCDACGKEGKDTPYLCLTCAFCVHLICATLHRTDRHVRHQHTLNLTYSLQIQPDH